MQLIAYVNNFMALAQAILAVLVKCPASGYDLAKKFDGSVGYFWKATHQQIYRELGKLEERGWIDSEAVTQTGKPEKKIYGITDLGIEELQSWMAQMTEPYIPKEDFLVKTFVGYLMPPEDMLKQLEQRCQSHLERLSVYRAIEKKYFSDLEKLSQADKFKYLTLRNGLMYEQYWIEWCEQAIAMIKGRSAI